MSISEEHQSWFLRKRINESLVIKNAKVDYFLKRVGKFGRSIGAGELVEIIKKSDLVRRLRREHNQIDLRQVIPPMREDTRKHLQNMLADDMRELTQQLGREDLPWPSWRALHKKAK